MGCQQNVMFVSRSFRWNAKKTIWKENSLLGGPAENESSPIISDTTKFMILIHLQTLGAGRHIQSFLNFWILNFWKIYIYIYNFFLHVTFASLVLHFFTGKRSKTQLLRMWRSRLFNSLHNGVCFSLLGQKLWEKIHF